MNNNIFRTRLKRVYEIIEKGKSGDTASIIFDYFIIFLIILNVIAIILESFESLSLKFNLSFRAFEIFSVIIFTIEYMLRLITAKYKIESKNIFISMIKYIFTPMALIDLLAILPFYLPMLIKCDLRFLRMLRLIRLLRIFKIQRYSNSLNMIGKVLKEKKEELFVTVFVTFLLLLIASSLMFYIEHDTQPDAFPNIISSFWWAVATLTTVGYGDVYPLTGWGKLLSGIIALLGIGLVALPTGIISSGFIGELQKKKYNEDIFKKNEYYCPNCGKRFKIEDE